MKIAMQVKLLSNGLMEKITKEMLLRFPSLSAKSRRVVTQQEGEEEVEAVVAVVVEASGIVVDVEEAAEVLIVEVVIAMAIGVVPNVRTLISHVVRNVTDAVNHALMEVVVEEVVVAAVVVEEIEMTEMEEVGAVVATVETEIETDQIAEVNLTKPFANLISYAYHLLGNLSILMARSSSLLAT